MRNVLTIIVYPTHDQGPLFEVDVVKVGDNDAMPNCSLL